MNPQRTFRSTSRQGLATDLFPMRLWRKAKKLGIWDPEAIDLTPDAEDWRRLDDQEQDVILRLSTLFQAGEESVTLDLLPLIQVIAEEGRLEEEMYLTTFLWEEAKHVELFHRFLRQVARCEKDISFYLTESYRTIFCEELPRALQRLRTDASPVAQAEASVTYNMIVEGVLAETGYYAYQQMLHRNGILPGMQEAVGHLRGDESRHMAYGVFLLSRLVAEHGESLWRAIEARLNHLLPTAVGVIHELFAIYDPMPFGLDLDDFLGYAMGQFEKRSRRIERARQQTLEDVLHMGSETDSGSAEQVLGGEIEPHTDLPGGLVQGR